jgi:hypothetical protein
MNARGAYGPFLDALVVIGGKMTAEFVGYPQGEGHGSAANENHQSCYINGILLVRFLAFR